MKTFRVALLLCLAFCLQSYAQDPPKPELPYKRYNIASARFGREDLQGFIQQAYRFPALVDESVKGQERIARLLQDRLIQWLENYGTRTKDPIATHLIGLPGVGKGSMVDVLEKLGIEVIRIDAQRFANENSTNEMRSLLYELMNISDHNAPVVVLFDELDKVPEIVRTPNGIVEKSNPLIGLFNAILNDGVFESNGIKVNLSNAFVMSAMNFSPEEIETFSKNALGEQKSFYEFTIEDFAKFDKWLRSSPNAQAMVLGRLFRSNTVSRIVPNTAIVKPLESADYRAIAKLAVDDSILRGTTGAAAEKRLAVTYSDSYLDFLAKHAVYAPSGARDTKFKTNALTEQLISMGTRATVPGDQSLGQPRQIHIDVDPKTSQAVITVTPRIRRGSETVDGNPFKLTVEFDPSDRIFIRPDSLSGELPNFPPPADPRDKPVRKSDIVASRFPKVVGNPVGMAARIDKLIVGQEEYTAFMEKELMAFLGKPGPVRKNPPFVVFAGFPGIGKSQIVELAAKEANLPVVKVNLQQFSSDEGAASDSLMTYLQEQISTAQTKRPDKKFMLQLEEMDKVFEIDPTKGELKSRPVMTIIKSLLNDGVVEAAVKDYGTVKVDIRGAYTAVTMNFAVDRFGFEADPRLTSIEDVISAWRRLSTRPSDLKSVLGSMFLPETVNRILSKVKIMRPLEATHYELVIRNQVEVAIRERLVDPATERNIGAIEVKLTPEYRRYLFDESVIPSEGARYAAESSRALINDDLEEAIRSIPKSSKMAGAPIVITLDYSAAKTSVRISAILKDAPQGTARDLLSVRKVTLKFPPLAANGLLPENRLITAVHEFGHFYSAVRTGKRFEYATVVPPKVGVGGYVKFRPSPAGAENILTDIYATLASRAMERIFFSKNPREATSVMEITEGASGDIKQATQALWDFLHEYGMDPWGGVIERRGVEGMSRYAHFADVPADEVQKLALVMQDMENFLVDDFLKANSMEWYKEKIVAFARKGGLLESEAYELLGYPFPGENSHPLGSQTRLREVFAGDIEALPASVKKAMAFEQGINKTTAEQNLDVAVKFFQRTLKERLHAGVVTPVVRTTKAFTPKDCEAGFKGIASKLK
jgi:AAA+ superfamily predicted ATPase